MPRPDIAILNPAAHLGGAELSLLELLSRLEEFYRFHVILPGDGPLRKKAEMAGAAVHLLPMPSAISSAGERGKGANLLRMTRAAVAVPAFTRSLSRLLRALRPAALITNGIKSHILGALAAGSDIPLIWYMREGLEGRALSRWLLRGLKHRCRAALCISNYVANQVRERLSQSLALHVMYNMIDLERFQPGLPLPPDLDKSADEVWFGVAGALTPLKGQDLFLQAAGRLKDHMPQARFLLIGSNFYATEKQNGFEQKLLKFAHEQGFEDRVHFLGFREDVANVIANLDVLVQSNRGPEGLGRSVLEAMVCAVPVISVDMWGPGEIVQDRVTGLRFPAGNSEALAACMLELGSNRELRRRLGSGGRRWAEENLCTNNLVTAFRAALDDVLRQNSLRVHHSQSEVPCT